MKKILNVANLVTLLGLIFVFWTISLAVYCPEKIWLIILFVLIVGMSDKLDGWLARKFKTETQFGAMFDRLRDKIFICSLLIILVLRYWPQEIQNKAIFSLVVALVALTIVLELSLIISGTVGIVKKVDIRASRYGKRKMGLQFGTVFFWFLSVGLEKQYGGSLFSWFIYLLTIVLFLSVIYAILSLADYLERYPMD